MATQLPTRRKRVHIALSGGSFIRGRRSLPPCRSLLAEAGHVKARAASSLEERLPPVPNAGMWRVLDSRAGVCSGLTSIQSRRCAGRDEANSLAEREWRRIVEKFIAAERCGAISGNGRSGKDALPRRARAFAVPVFRSIPGSCSGLSTRLAPGNQEAAPGSERGGIRMRRGRRRWAGGQFVMCHWRRFAGGNCRAGSGMVQQVQGNRRRTAVQGGGLAVGKGVFIASQGESRFYGRRTKPVVAEFKEPVDSKSRAPPKA